MTLEGTVQNGVVVLDPGSSLPEGTRVEVRISNKPESAPTLGQRLMKHAGTVSGLPTDLAEQHDHYLYGTPKK